MKTIQWTQVPLNDVPQLGTIFGNCLLEQDSRFLLDGNNGDIEYWMMTENDHPVVLTVTRKTEKNFRGFKGFMSKVPTQYNQQICDFLNSMSEYTASDTYNFLHLMNIIQINGQWVVFDTIKDGTTIKHSLNLNNTRIDALPENLTIHGCLQLCNSKITSLPKSLRVTEYIDVRFTQISTLSQLNKVINTSPRIRDYHNERFRKTSYSG